MGIWYIDTSMMAFDIVFWAKTNYIIRTYRRPQRKRPVSSPVLSLSLLPVSQGKSRLLFHLLRCSGYLSSHSDPAPVTREYYCCLRLFNFIIDPRPERDTDTYSIELICLLLNLILACHWLAQPFSFTVTADSCNGRYVCIIKLFLVEIQIRRDSCVTA